jgi:dTDP-glucose 4,6-dehydratase
MVYGVPESNPIAEHHPRIPIGEYGLSKLAAEEYIMDRQLRGDVQSTIFRPRLILGSGRLGFFDKIFQLVERNLPIPIIGNGCNHFPYLSVSDLVKAVTKVIKQDCWNEVFNVSSEKSPPVHDVLSALIKHSNSRSWIIKLPSDLTKYLLESLDTISFSPLYPEQFHIADKDFVLDISNIKKALNWTPEINDLEMLISSYDQFKRDRYSDLH